MKCSFYIGHFSAEAAETEPRLIAICVYYSKSCFELIVFIVYLIFFFRVLNTTHTLNDLIFEKYKALILLRLCQNHSSKWSHRCFQRIYMQQYHCLSTSVPKSVLQTFYPCKYQKPFANAKAFV